jgi:hypothetical protein
MIKSDRLKLNMPMHYSFSDTVVIITEDGSTLHLNYTYVIESNRDLLVYTEHNGYFELLNIQGYTILT